MAAQREPKVGRRPGNQDTRGQIITAARLAFAEKGFAGASMRAIAAEAGVDAALIHHYFDSKQQLFLATVALPLELPRIVERVAAGSRSDLGERLVRTVLGVWDSELQPSLVASIRTTLTDPALTRSVGEFLALEVIGQVLAPRRPPGRGGKPPHRLARITDSGPADRPLCLANAGSSGPRDGGLGSRDRPDRPAIP